MYDFADELRGDEPPSRIRFAALWIFTTIFSALIVLAVVAAGMRMVGV